MIIEVQTTQNVTIDYEIANVGKRILAYLLDWVVIMLWFFGWLWILSTVARLGLEAAIDGDISAIIIWIILFYPMLFYDFLFERFNNGQSLGKMVLKIRVVNVNGTAPTTGSFLVRWLFRLIDFTITYGFVGVIMVAVSKKSQRLGDLLAGTTVVDLKLNAGNRELSITDLDFHEDYKVTYADVLDRLSDRDIQTIVSIIEDRRMRDSDYFNQRLAERIKSITGYNYDGPDRVFLKKIVNDYNFLAVQE
ncbi:putative RDD family membrane protein YckC [Dysgonomonas hofstadii]|uniref:Putative RDD family membrane protein YckC n=1 Tax=Dysgonomonas hofstadii TaxID=637886 RepID=A0A840CV64_9BACT|nr:RDD family protein [Dysgonomonas hofstadii]MBB4035683.1 putative RDD family membrane protein YckC [Dysgonomonas hofstadii]